MERPIIACLAVGAAGVLANPAAAQYDVQTSFEFFDVDGFFSLGTAPETVSFSNGEAKSVGNFSLYTDGFNAWMIDVGQTGTIGFGTPAEEVSFFIRDQSAGVGGQLSVTRIGGAVDTFEVPDAFQEMTFTDVLSIDIENNFGGTGVGYVAIDQFKYRAIPAPGAACLLLIGAPRLIRRRR